ncbi:MAG: Uma2 family endonuclease [Leptospiraceae bacterium]|nr:Uma2 family endonuclease [Leptospiraceae bacterium]MCK6382151.1 Uma2 family endonuclease [Leptospiraceae bacterium]NUM40428.1 Uma2 family endonuclease [Leptospiraceae bacterium]
MVQALLENPEIRKLVTPFTVEKYHLMYEQGLISEKTELLEGVVIEKMPKNPIHTATLNKIFYFFISKILPPYSVRKEDPISFDISEPEPDISIVDYREDSYSLFHPSFAHLVVEVANTSLELDRQKSFIYSKGKIPEYWIINLNENTVEVYTNPTEDGYQNKLIRQKNEEITPTFSKSIQFQLINFL